MADNKKKEQKEVNKNKETSLNKDGKQKATKEPKSGVVNSKAKSKTQAEINIEKLKNADNSKRVVDKSGRVNISRRTRKE